MYVSHGSSDQQVNLAMQLQSTLSLRNIMCLNHEIEGFFNSLCVIEPSRSFVADEQAGDTEAGIKKSAEICGLRLSGYVSD